MRSNKKIVSLVFALSMIPAQVAASDSASCEKLPENYQISNPVTVAEVEIEWSKDLPEMTRLRPDIPQLPFGFINDRWNRFKAKIKDGDILVRFISDQQSWKNLAGREGLAVLRRGCLVDVFTVTMN